MYKHAIFDIDGTLLDSLPSLQEAINTALKNLGYNKVYSFEESKKLIGDGAYVLAQRAIAPFSSQKEDVDELYKEYMHLYVSCQAGSTRPFEHLKDVLEMLKENDVSLYVFSNKPQEYANLILDALYGKSIFTEVIGDRKDGHLKPDPHNLEEMLKKRGIAKSDAIYIGDGETDIKTANNAHIDMCLVTYGYGDYSHIDHNRVQFVASSPIKLLDIILH